MDHPFTSGWRLGLQTSFQRLTAPRNVSLNADTIGPEET